MFAIKATSYKYQSVRTKIFGKIKNHCFSTLKGTTEQFDSSVISWYPGHIAKAERQLQDYLKKVDVVIEVRDARIPIATTHPKVPTWVGSRPIIVCMVRMDVIPKHAIEDMKAFHSSIGTSNIFYINAKKGSGVSAMKRSIIEMSKSVNERRGRMGMTARPIRVAIIGFPNVGKSTLINRILGRNIAKAENTPGVTRSIQWVRLGVDNSYESRMVKNNGNGGPLTKEEIKSASFELLDSPGIIPPGNQITLESAIMLAICNEIGTASYDKIKIAKQLCTTLNKIYKKHPQYVDMQKIELRYKIPFSTMLAEDIFYHICETYCQDDDISCANKILGDFRKGLLGLNALQACMNESELLDIITSHITNSHTDTISNSNMPMNETKDNNKNTSKNTSKNTRKNTSKNTNKNNNKNNNKNTSKNTSKNTNKNNNKNTSKKEEK